jgi:hypothetical protein
MSRRCRQATVRGAAVLLAAAALFAVPPASAAELLLRIGDGSVPAGTIVNGDAIVIGGTLSVDGTVTGNATAVGGSVRVGGHVGGNVSATGGNVILDSTAVVDGTVRSEGGSVRVAPGAVIRRAPAQSAPPSPFPRITPLPSPFPAPVPGVPFWMPFYGVLAVWKLVAGVLVALALLTFVGAAWLTAVLFPGATAAVADTLDRNPGAAGLAGAAAWLLVGPVAVLLVLSVAGILLVLLLIAALLMAVQLGVSAVALLIGRRVRPGGVGLEALLGAVLLAIALAVPHVGWVAAFAAVTWGTGGVIVTIAERRGGGRPVPPASSTPTSPAPPASPPSPAR